MSDRIIGRFMTKPKRCPRASIGRLDIKKLNSDKRNLSLNKNGSGKAKLKFKNNHPKGRYCQSLQVKAPKNNNFLGLSSLFNHQGTSQTVLSLAHSQKDLYTAHGLTFNQKPSEHEVIREMPILPHDDHSIVTNGPKPKRPNPNQPGPYDQNPSQPYPKEQ
ncbi:MAG: hypothetical protein LBE80_01005, partial [Deltaproteobacteria bacterium]|nr:hypothetical protein [Deltaproteobacteria bacterium]